MGVGEIEQEELSMGMTVSGIIGTSNPNVLPVSYKIHTWIMLCIDKCSLVARLKNWEKRLACIHVYHRVGRLYM